MGCFPLAYCVTIVVPIVDGLTVRGVCCWITGRGNHVS